MDRHSIDIYDNFTRDGMRRRAFLDEAALNAAHKHFDFFVYPDVNHASNNDIGRRHDKAAAELAWGRTSHS